MDSSNHIYSSRDLRQQECLSKWVKAKCVGTLECATGFGKTRIALMAIKAFRNKNPGTSVIVIVPTTQLQSQWEGLLITNGIAFVDVLVINTAVKQERQCDMLIIDKFILSM